MTTYLCSATAANNSAAYQFLQRSAENWALRLVRAAVLGSLFSLIFLQEYFRASAGAVAGFLYSVAAGGFRNIDLLILLLVVLHAAALACSRERWLLYPRAILIPGVGFVLTIVGAAIYGSARGGTNLFFDWRALALGLGLYVVWAFWIQTSADRDMAVLLFTAVVAIRLGALYFNYFSGNGEILQGITIPVYDGPTISCLVFAALLGFSYGECVARRLPRFFLLGLSVLACVMVALCFRRTYWVQLAIGALILLVLRKRRATHGLLGTCAVIGLAAVLLGPQFYTRLQSFNLTQSDSEFSGGNADHVDDLLDAWDQVHQSPVLGIGLGTHYPTWRIRSWKGESVMVHNATLHVWLKYGLAGLVFYLWFHWALFRWMRKRSKHSPYSNAAFPAAALAYLLAQFATSLSFAPWPYSELQMTTLLSFIVAASVVPMPSRPARFVGYGQLNQGARQ